MLKVCEQAVEKLGKSMWQTQKLYTSRPQTLAWFNKLVGLYTSASTGFAQFYSAFTQAFSAILNLLTGFLYPVSTAPINNTNLIKE